MREPALLRALDNVLEVEGGWVADCPHWGCGGLLEVTAEDDHWHLACDAGCGHEELAAYLQCHTSLPLDVAATRRLWRALVLAPSLEVCEALLKEQPVPRSALDPDWLRRFGL